MKHLTVICILVSGIITSAVASAFNVNFSLVNLITPGDSETSFAGQPSWVSGAGSFTNRLAILGTPVFSCFNVAVNGNYLDSSGGMQDGYPTDVLANINATKTNIIAVQIGVNNHTLRNIGDATNYIANGDTYVRKCITNANTFMCWQTILYTYDITNATTGLIYQTNLSMIKNWIFTNAQITFKVDLDPPITTNRITDSAWYIDNPPTHWQELGAASAATNVWLTMTTNATPPSPAPFR